MFSCHSRKSIIGGDHEKTMIQSIIIMNWGTKITIGFRTFSKNSSMIIMASFVTHQSTRVIGHIHNFFCHSLDFGC